MHILRSPNFSSRSTTIVDTIVLHHTNMVGANNISQRFLDPLTEVSAHYLITTEGDIIQYVDEQHKAHHAGLSYWRGRDKVNDFSIGIELENSGLEPFPKAQIKSLLKLLEGICARHPICHRNIVGHYDVALNRKDDPNYLFPWQEIFEHGFGIYCTEIKNISKTVVDISHLKQQLTLFGYKINETTHTLQMAVNAFRKHYCPEAFSTPLWWDSLSEHRLARLLPDTLDSEC